MYNYQNENKQITRLRKIWTKFLLVVIVSSLTCLFFYYVVTAYNVPVPVLAQTYQENPITSDHSSSDDVRLVKRGVYNVYPKPVTLDNSQIVWFINLFSTMRSTYQWNVTQLEKLLSLLRQNLSDEQPFDQNQTTSPNMSGLAQQLDSCHLSARSSSMDGCYPINLGSLPERLSDQPALTRTFKQNNPVYTLKSVYWKPIPMDDGMKLIECSKTGENRRRLLHDTLQHWIRFAEQHRIWWSLAFGSLIGSMRDGDIIPYDTDMDIFVLASDEPKIRHLATNRMNIIAGQFNLVTRPGSSCMTNGGERTDCKGHTVSQQTDTCSFCGPLARVFMADGIYIDLFPINIELHANDIGYPINFGCTSEERPHLGVLKLSMLFPLKQCWMMNLIVSCPREPARLLELLYDRNWRHPKYLCNGSSGVWEPVR